MRVATIGSDPLLSLRRRVLVGIDRVELVALPSAGTSEADASDTGGINALFIGVPRAERFEVAARAARSGTHVFIEWPPVTSIRECAALVRLAEESGVECGVSRPLRFSPPLEPAGHGFRARAVSLSFGGGAGGSDSDGDHIGTAAGLELQETSAAYPEMSRLLADAVDLSCALVKSSSVRRIDAEVVRNETSQPEAVLFSLRFHSGGYAQAVVRLDGRGGDAEVYAAGSGMRIEGTLPAGEATIRRETEGFVEALATGRPAPVSALDALYTMRIVERLQGALR